MISKQVDTRKYETISHYDALNRPVRVQLPGVATVAEPHFLVPRYNRAGALEGVVLSADAAGTNPVLSVDHIAYNARGQRLLLALGNGRMTRYAYA